MYRSRYRPISDNTDRTRVYRTFRLEKRNSASTKTKRKNRRNAWFEQTPMQQVATTLTSPIRSYSSFFFFSSSRLLSFSTTLISSLFCWTMNIATWFLFLCFVTYLKFPKPFYTLEMLKTYIFLIKDGLNGLAFTSFLVLSPTLCDALIASHQLRGCLVHALKNWKLLFENCCLKTCVDEKMCRNTCNVV